MKQIYSARNELDAQMVKNALADAEIESVVQGGPLSAVLGEIPVTEGSLPSVWVRDEDVQRATEALANFQHPAVPTEAPWTCPKCGETIEPQFTACWNCGTAKPGAAPTE
jgi:hypothetical protein